ncbi:MAG: hypothetical protein P8Z49_04390 [Acidobacteriota bacterium]
MGKFFRPNRNNPAHFDAARSAEGGRSGWMLGKRRLKGPELNELQRHILRRRKLPLTFLFVASGLFVFLCRGLAAGAPGRWFDVNKWYVIPLAGLLLLLLGFYVQNLMVARRMDRDRRFGWVLVAHRTSRSKEAGERATPAEILPASSLLWTRNGRPAPWRRSRRSSRPSTSLG